jgi:uncharacterized protein
MIVSFLWYFMIYSFLGWVTEVVFHAVVKGRIINRGFLNGPLCPVYGAGMCAVLWISSVLKAEDPLILFLVGMVFATLIELTAGFILDRLFHARWWDYSRVPLNINGRTSVPTSIAFGAASIPVMKTVLPAADALIGSIPESAVNLAALMLVAVCSADTTLTVSALTDFQKKVTAIDDAFQNRMTDTVEHIVNVQNHFHKKAIERIPLLMLSGQKAEIAKKLKENRLSELIARYRRSNKT